ncbi:DUF6907 domain-containing protein [Streptosporangium roseum]|uniref:Uncharacterized protein n=1 Tax=Streptosporangium roseum (strain ATCC 12428 / DSM 43021 / JCM 3005 / KCTC 9067 / NCIMB 10171 / NRRL 2505 / NI 9100) TaxID=479432 RepID=D2ATF0_STRRD|nr:hypothetical protein [Streptosporangium roseum]ACZ84826.1 hypothetical protein Sros_1838 [Streptosporangium roseum DSM 43021]
MSKRTTLTVEGATSPVNLRTRSTGTVHVATADGRSLCPARVAADGVEVVSAPVSCRSCLKLQPVKVVERQELPAAPPADIIRLTGDQLDGVACIRCSATDAPMVPAGTGERGQLFECADHGREYGVRGTVDHGNGPQIRTYTGTDAVGMLAELRDVQHRQGGVVDAVVVSRPAGGEWAPAAPSCSACPAWCRADHGNGVDVEHEGELITVAAPEAAEGVEVVARLLQFPGGALRLSLGLYEGVECDAETELFLTEAERLVEHLQTLITAARAGARS